MGAAVAAPLSGRPWRAVLVVLLAAGGALLGGPAASADEADVWASPTPMMNDARENHTSTLLPDGRVLVTGGTFLALPDKAKATAALYDPAANAWTSAAPMGTARYDHTATLLLDGRVLVTGGYGPGGSRSSTELYTPATNAWTPGAPMNRARENQTATLLPGGRVLVGGGLGDDPSFASSSEVYDPATNTWSAPVTMNGNRKFNATAALMATGKVLVVGGSDVTATDTAETYDPATDAWTPVTSMAIAREQHTETLLPGGKVLVAGGVPSRLTGSPIAASAELYDPATNAWAPAAPMTSPRYAHTATMLANGKVFVAGGRGGADTVVRGGSLGLMTAEVYDPAANAWTPAASMRSGRYDHAATLLADGRVIVDGGVNVSTSEIWGRPAASSAAIGGTPGPAGVVPGAAPAQTAPTTAAASCAGQAGSALSRCKARVAYQAARVMCRAINTTTRTGRTRRARCLSRARASYRRTLAAARCRSITSARQRAACAARARRLHG